MKYFYCLLLLICILIKENVYAQNLKDAGIWTTISVEKDITNKISIGIDEEMRLRDNFSRLNLFYTNFNFNYKPIKNFKIGIAYRSIEKWQYKWQQFSFRHRLMLDLTYKYKSVNWEVAYRSRVQSELQDIYSDDKGKIPEWFWRHKFDFKYKIKNLDPYAGLELRYQIADPRMPESNGIWHRLRYYAGVDYDINDFNTVGVYYLIQHEFNVIKPEYIYIVGLQYKIQL